MTNKIDKNKFFSIVLIIFLFTLGNFASYDATFAQTNREEVINEGNFTGPSTAEEVARVECANNSIEYKTLVKIPGFGQDVGGENVVKICANSLGQYLQVGFNYFIGIAIALAVVMIIYGGVLYATTEAVYGKSDARNTIMSAVQGLALALGSWLILYTINPDLLKFQLDIGTLKLQGSTEGGRGAAVAELTSGTLSEGGSLVVDGTARDIAARLLVLDSTNKIALGTRVKSGTQASSKQNIIDTAAGRPASLSNGSRIAIDASTLAMLEALHTRYNFTMTVSAIVGGAHSATSRHYVGKSIDINYINGVHVGSSGSKHREFMAACRALGATEVLGPGDPGHSTHVHCSLPR